MIMNQLAPAIVNQITAVIAAAGERAQTRFLEFFVGPDPQQTHSARLRTGDAGVSGLVRVRRASINARSGRILRFPAIP